MAKKLEKQEIVMEDRDGRQDERILLTQEEEASLTLLEPLFARHRDLIFENLPRYIRSEPDGASLLSGELASARLTRVQQEHSCSLPKGGRGICRWRGRRGGRLSRSLRPWRRRAPLDHRPLSDLHSAAVFDAFGASGLFGLFG